MAKAGAIKIEILVDGVFIADDERRDIGAVETVSAVIALVLIENGHARKL